MANEILTAVLTITATVFAGILVYKNFSIKQQPIKPQLSMTLEETEETIKNWISTCTSEVQLNLCRDAIDQFVFHRFKNHAPGQEAIHAMSRLTALVADRRVELLIK